MPPIAPADEAAVAVMTDVLNIRLDDRDSRDPRPGERHATAGAGDDSSRRPAARAIGRTSGIDRADHPLFAAGAGADSRAGRGADAEELEQVKGGHVLGKWQGSLDGALDASATYANETARFGSLDHLLKWPAAVRAVTAQAVSAAAQKYIHPETMGTVVIGQIDEVRKARHPRWPVALDEVMTGAPR